MPPWLGINTEAWRWRDEEANVRIHGTTRERPLDRFLLEKTRLQPLPPTPYDTSLVMTVGVGRQGPVNFDANRYSVPAAFSGSENGTVLAIGRIDNDARQ